MALRERGLFSFLPAVFTPPSPPYWLSHSSRRHQSSALGTATSPCLSFLPCQGGNHEALLLMGSVPVKHTAQSELSNTSSYFCLTSLAPEILGVCDPHCHLMNAL